MTTGPSGWPDYKLGLLGCKWDEGRTFNHTEMGKRLWTQEEIDILTRMYPDHFASEIQKVLDKGKSAIYCKAKQLGLESTPEKIRRSGMMSCNHPNNVAARFTKGHVPDNKGKKMSSDQYAKCQPTMFKKGQPCWNHKEVGSERTNRDGYREVKVAEPNKWKLKHRVIWEQENGPIPKGYNVQFKNHNPQDLRIENLYLISKMDQMRNENSYYTKYPKELQEVIRLKGVVNRIIHKQQRNGK